MWELHLREMQWWIILWTTSGKYRGWHHWKVLGPAPCRSNHLEKTLMKRLTKEQWKEYNNTTNCFICTKLFKLADGKDRNHNYMTGEYRGPAHKAYNLNFHFHAVFCLVLKLFILSKLILNSTLHHWIFLTTREQSLILNKKVWML